MVLSFRKCNAHKFQAHIIRIAKRPCSFEQFLALAEFLPSNMIIHRCKKTLAKRFPKHAWGNICLFQGLCVNWHIFHSPLVTSVHQKCISAPQVRKKKQTLIWLRWAFVEQQPTARWITTNADFLLTDVIFPKRKKFPVTRRFVILAIQVLLWMLLGLKKHDRRDASDMVKGSLSTTDHTEFLRVADLQTQLFISNPHFVIIT